MTEPMNGFRLRLSKWALMGLIITLPFTGVTLVDVAKLKLYHLFGLALILLVFSSTDSWRTLKKLPLAQELLAFAGLAVLSTLAGFLYPGEPLATAQGRSLPAVRSIFSAALIFYSIGVYGAAFYVIKRQHLLKSSLRAWLLTGSAASIYGLVQYIGYVLGAHTGLRYTEVFWAVPRLASVSLEPLYFANYLLSVIPLLFVAIGTGEKLLPEGILHLLLGANLLALLFTYSLGGLIAMVIALAVVMLSWRKFSSLQHFRRIAITLIATVLAFAVVDTYGKFDLVRAYESFLPKLGVSLPATRAHPSASQPVPALAASTYSRLDRLELLQAASGMFRAHPLLGVGPGNYAFHFNEYRPKGTPARAFVTVANNEYVEILAEQGIVGFIVLVLAFIHAVRLVADLYKRVSTPIGHVVLWGVGAGLIGMLVQFGAFSGLTIPYLWVALAVFWAGITEGRVGVPTPTSGQATRR